MATATDATDPAASLTSLLTRLQALPPRPLATAAPAHSNSLATSLPALAAKLGHLNDSARPTSLPSSLLASLSSLLSFTPSQETEALVTLAWEAVRTVVVWIVLRELAPSGSGSKGEEQGEGRKEWEACLRGLLQGVLEHVERTEELDQAGGTGKDQPYRTLISSLLSPTLVKLVIPAPEEGGWSREIVDSVPNLARYAALDIFSDLLSKHAPNKSLARQLLPAASLGALLRSSTDFHLSQSAMEIAYRTVPPFNPKSSSTSSDNPKKQWIDQLFPVELFGTDTEMFREKFYKLTGKTYYEEMTEILKLISLANIKRSQPFMAHSLIYNSTRTLISPSNDTEIWFCPHSILGLLHIPNEEGEYYDERFYLALSDVRAIEIEDGPEGDEDFIVIEMILDAPPHLGNSLLHESVADDEEKGLEKLVMKTTRRGSAFEALKRTMEERARRYPALTPHLTSSGTSTSSRPTILNPPPPGAPGAQQPLTKGHSKKPRSSQAGPIVGFFKDPPPKPQSVNGDLDTPVFEEESETMRRGKVLAAMAELNEDLRSEGSKGRGFQNEGEEGEVGVKELVSGQVVREEEEKEGGEAMEGQQEVAEVETDAGEMSSDLSSIEDSDKEEVEVKVNPPPKSRQPSKTTTSSRKSTAARSVVVSVGPHPSPIKRRSPRLSHKPVSKKQQQQDRDPTHSIEEKRLVRAALRKPKPIVDEILEADSESLPKQQQIEPPHPSSHEVASNAPKEKVIFVKRPKRGASKPKEVVVVAAAEPAAVPLMPKKTKRARSPSPAPIAVPLAHASPTAPPRPKTKTTITDQPAYPKRRRITDPSPVDKGAPYEATLEEKKSSGRYSLQEKKKSGVPSPRKKYGRERKERKVAEGVKVTRVGERKGKGKKVELEESEKEEEDSEKEEEESEEEEVVSLTKGKKKAKTKKPVTDFDSLPHIKTKKTNVKDTLKSKDKETVKSKMKGKKDDPPVSASTTKSTKSTASRSTRGAVEKDMPATKKAGVKSKKAEMFSQLVATPPAPPPRRSPSPPLALRHISQIADDSESQQEKFDIDFGLDIPPQRPSPEVQHPPTSVTDCVQQPQAQVEDAQKSTGSLPLDPALDPSFVRNALGEDRSEPAHVVVKEVKQPQEEGPQREKSVEEVGDRAEQQEAEKESPAAEVEVEVENEQPAAQEEEQLRGFAIAEEETVVDMNAEGGDNDEGAGESLQALEADVESAAENEVELGEFDGDEMVVDSAGEDSGFFAAEDDEVLAAQEQPKQDAAAAVELVPNTSSAPQPSFEQLGARHQRALKVSPVNQPSSQLKKPSANLLPRASPLLAKSNSLRPPRISLLANQAQPRGSGRIFSAPRPAPSKTLVPPRPRRRASSEPPNGRREGGEGSPRALARSHGRHSEPEPKRMKEKQGRSKSKTATKKKSGRKSKGKERERAVYSDEEEPNGDGFRQDHFEQELRAQLDDMVKYIVLKAQARRLASAHAFEASQRRIKKQFAKGAESMHENTVAVAVTAREQVEQLRSAPVKLAALRDRQRQANKAMEVELSKM